jgi:hypothetical protein
MAQIETRDASAAEQGLREQKHFLECLAFVYRPALWIGYNEKLYFMPKTAGQEDQVASMKEARSQYQAFTDRQQRHQLAAEALAESGLSEQWQKKLLLPYSDTNQNLTPTIERPLRILPVFKLLQPLNDGDALIEDETGQVYFVMGFGRAANDTAGTNAYLIKEGMKTYTTPAGAYKLVEAFSSVSLSQEETAVLKKAAAAFKKKAASLNVRLNAARDFEALRVRATDTNPYMQYLLARSYLEGNGTPKDDQLGLDWMKRAAKNGSGDASTWLSEHEEKARK